MKSTTIRVLKHNTTTVLSWVAGGESVEVRQRARPVAILSPPKRKVHVLPSTATNLISETRGES